MPFKLLLLTLIYFDWAPPLKHIKESFWNINVIAPQFSSQCHSYSMMLSRQGATRGYCVFFFLFVSQVSSEPSITLHSEGGRGGTCALERQTPAGRWQRNLIYDALIIVRLCERKKKKRSGRTDALPSQRAVDVLIKSLSDSQSHHKCMENTCESADQNRVRPTLFT